MIRYNINFLLSYIIINKKLLEKILVTLKLFFNNSLGFNSVAFLGNIKFKTWT